VEGDKLKVPSPRILQAGIELHKAGVPLNALLREIEVLREDTDRLTRSFVQLVAKHLIDPLTDKSLPSPDQINQIGQVIERLRPLAEMVVNAEMAKGLRRHANVYIGDKFREILQQYEGEPGRKPPLRADMTIMAMATRPIFFCITGAAARVMLTFYRVVVNVESASLSCALSSR
jgi:hypothetical protein